MSKKKGGGKPFLSLFSDLFKINLNIRDMFKFSLFSDNPGRRDRTNTNTVNSNNTNDSSRYNHGGVFVPARLTDDQAAYLLGSDDYTVVGDDSDDRPVEILRGLRASLQDRQSKKQ